MPGRESKAHLSLKRLALHWAQRQGYRIAAAEVSVPTLGGVRLDAAAYRPMTGKGSASSQRIGATVVFECKGARGDFLKDSRSAVLLAERLQKLHERRVLYEEGLRNGWPHLRNGEELFPEFDSYRFELVGWEPYEKVLAEIRKLTARLHGQTKFARLLRWKAANLHYVVAEPEVARAHELPAGWGLLVRSEAVLEVAVPAIWQEATDQARWNLLLRIAMCGTRAVNRHLEVDLAMEELALG